ncbi:MAG: IMP cyclohydrolase [Lachnospiraceae bacterium]|nr:IMP cyclohydrolase [Lachnospiraceae bacterium]
MNIYEIGSIAEKLKNNTYPGRGIILGITPDGTKKVSAYFIMGRSTNSRNRVFSEEVDGISTEAFDPSLLEDPSLIIYHPVRELGDDLVVTNGDQTDTIVDTMKNGGTFEEALRTREFEPDGPNWTPRISGIQAKDGSYKLSILKSVDLEGSACVRQFFEYPAVPGLGHFIHTYVTDGNPIPTFQGEPERVDIVDDLDTYAGMLWTNLNRDNRVSLFVRFTDIESGEYEQLIINDNV